MEGEKVLESYKQTTNYTGAASALLSILHFFQETEFTRENELDIWLKSVILPTRASSVFGIAIYAKEKGLQPKIILEDAHYTYPDYRFKRYTKKQIELAEIIANRYRREAEEKGILIVERDFDVNYVDSLLQKGKILLVRVNAGRLRGTKSTSKYIVVYKKSIEKGKYFIIDPRRRRKKVTREQLEESLEELKTKKKREKCMIVF
ncbi:MAG: peptidase C39 family protein [Nanoarchaeota archaeon]|nr:peptidase C39 family protein [Nanoarchaeota archaeon]